jgi:diguanylate cyclase (GGDEF)-like protein
MLTKPLRADISGVSLTLAWVLVALGVAWGAVGQLRLRRLTRRCVAEQSRVAVLDERLRVVSRLHDAGRAVNSVHELDHVLGTILNGVVDMLGAETGSVMLVEDEELRGVAAVGNERALGARLSFGEGIAGRVAVVRNAMLINGEVSDGNFPGLRPRRTPVESAISVPMVERDQLIGVLNVTAPATHLFNHRDLEAARAFAEYAAAAIAKARLYDNSRRKSEELAYRATHDALTGLPNRSMLRDRLLRDGTSTSCGALLFIDLDGFKAVNDMLGHTGGDLLLEAVAGRLMSSVSTRDTAARVGGDEFAVFVTGGSDLRPAIAVAERLIQRLSEQFVVFDEPVSVSASIGIAQWGVHGDSFEELFEAADHALYEAKKAGKNRWRVCARPALPAQRAELTDAEGGALCRVQT